MAFPVVACVDPRSAPRSSRRRDGTRASWWPRSRPRSSGRSTFYSDGVHTLLGPAGWTCAHGGVRLLRTGVPGARPRRPRARRAPPGPRLAAAPPIGQSAAMTGNGATTLALYPPNDPDPTDLGRAGRRGGGDLRHLRRPPARGRGRPRVPVLHHPVVAGAARPDAPPPSRPASSATP